MERSFPETLSALRRQKNISQRTAAAELNISQALLSHYENGAREPGLAFICKVCEYYGVTADYLLCRSEEPNGVKQITDMSRAFLQQLRSMTEEAEAALDRREGQNLSDEVGK